jgi:hypothetical protein
MKYSNLKLKYEELEVSFLDNIPSKDILGTVKASEELKKEKINIIFI